MPSIIESENPVPQTAPNDPHSHLARNGPERRVHGSVAIVASGRLTDPLEAGSILDSYCTGERALTASGLTGKPR